MLALYCYCRDNVKQGLFQNTCFKGSNTKAAEKNLRQPINFCKKIISSSYQIELKTFIEASCKNNNTLEKKLFVAAIFEGL